MQKNRYYVLSLRLRRFMQGQYAQSIQRIYFSISYSYKFYRNRTTLRKTILKKIRAKAVRIWRKAKATIFDSKQMISALAWIKNCDMYDYYRKHIKPFIDFGKLKHKISTADRKARCIEYDRIQARRKYAIGQTA